MTDFNDRIERLAELEGKATPGEWEEYDLTFGGNVIKKSIYAISHTLEQNITDFDDPQADINRALICTLRNEALPLLREMAQALSEARAESEALKGQFLDHAETDSYLRMVKYAAHVKDLYRWEKEQKEAAQAENERLRARQAKLKETLLPVCEYAAEIYNRGIPAIPMPDDTIQRLNWAFKMFGG